MNSESQKHFKTIILSDIHLGTTGSKAQEVVRFLRRYSCDLLILNGDIIDGWELKKSGSWKVQHTRFFRMILKMIEENQTRVIYLHGNHDDFVDAMIPITIGNFSLQMDYIYESFGKRYYIVHGDIFDTVTTNLKWIAKLGSVAYNLLLSLNKLYNFYRKKRGLPYYSFSQYIKSKVKSAVSRATDYETQLTELAKIKGCQAIICGHTHKPGIKNLGEIVYMNSGDWVESLTALTEDQNGDWELYRYTDEFEIDFNQKTEDTEEDIEIDQLKAFYPLSLLPKQK